MGGCSREGEGPDLPAAGATAAVSGTPRRRPWERCSCSRSAAAGCGGGSEDTARANGLIAFSTPAGPKYRIYVMEPDGTGRRPLTDGALNEECPRWSPDGTRVSLEAYRESSNGQIDGSWIEVVDANGQVEWRVEAEPTRCPEWSPDGSKLSLVSNSTLPVVDASGGEPRELVDDVAARRDVAWSPDGSEIAYVPTGHDDASIGSLAISVVGVDDGQARLLTVGGDSCADDVGPTSPSRFRGGQAVAWGPGDEILFALDGSEFCENIYAVEADGSNGRAVSAPGQAAAQPAWSPDGSRIAFAGSGGGPGLGRTSDDEVWITEPDSTDFVNVTDNLENEYWPLWSPDGTKLAFLRSGDSNTDALYVADATGGAPLRLEDDVSQSGPSWQALP